MAEDKTAKQDESDPEVVAHSQDEELLPCICDNGSTLIEPN
jgi:hypothetical protein